MSCDTQARLIHVDPATVEDYFDRTPVVTVPQFPDQAWRCKRCGRVVPGNGIPADHMCRPRALASQVRRLELALARLGELSVAIRPLLSRPPGRSLCRSPDRSLCRGAAPEDLSAADVTRSDELTRLLSAVHIHLSAVLESVRR